MNDLTIDKTFTLLHVLLQNIHVCIDVVYAKRVLPLVLLESVPSSSPYLVGLMNLEGVTIPVIDLSMCLGMPRSEPYKLDITIILCSDGNQDIGIIVDKVIGLIDVFESDLQMRSDFKNSDSPIQAIVPVQTELSLILNMRRLLAINFMITELNLAIDPTLLNQAKKRHE